MIAAVATTYLDVTVTGAPRAQTRPRVFAGGGRQADSPACVAWKAAIVAAILETGWTAPPADAPLELAIELALPTAQKARVGRPATGRPDLDNLAKAAGDALMAPGSRALVAAVKRLPGRRSYPGVIADDAAIVRLVASKRWAREGGCRLVLRDAGPLA